MPFLVPISLLLLACAILLRIDALFVVVWFLIGTYVASRVWMRVAVRQLGVWRRFTDHAFLGDEVEVELGLRNASRLPLPWIEFEESVPLDLRDERFPAHAISLPGRTERRFSYRLVCKRRGYYALGPMRVQTGDVLGIDQLSLQALEPSRLTVYPRIVTLDRLGLPTRSALVALPTVVPLFEDPSRIVGVREYRAGDSPRRIHWGATARLNQLAVKQYQPAVARETVIFLDLDVRDYDLRQRFTATETAIVVAASLAHHIIERESLPVGLHALGRDIVFPDRVVALPPRSEAAHLMQILESLARLETVTSGSFVERIRHAMVRMQWGSTALIVTGTLNDDLSATLLQLRRAGHAVAVVLVVPDTVGSVMLSGLGSIPIHRVWSDDDMAVL